MKTLKIPDRTSQWERGLRFMSPQGSWALMVDPEYIYFSSNCSWRIQVIYNVKIEILPSCFNVFPENHGPHMTCRYFIFFVHNLNLPSVVTAEKSLRFFIRTESWRTRIEWPWSYEIVHWPMHFLKLLICRCDIFQLLCFSRFAL